MLYGSKNIPSLCVFQSKEDGEKEEEKQKAKRGRPPLKSTLLSNLSCALSKAANSESKPGARSARGSLPDGSPLSNGTEGTPGSSSG